MLGPFSSGHALAPRSGRLEHLGVDADPFGLVERRIRHGQRPRVGDAPGERRGGGRLRAAQIHLVLRGTGAAGEVARDRAQADPPRGGRLAHADAAVAAGLVDPRAGVDELAR